jgi:HlyD family secretion protein
VVVRTFLILLTLGIILGGGWYHRRYAFKWEHSQATLPSPSKSEETIWGRVVADRESRVSFRASGRIKAISVSEGSSVHPGQILAYLEDEKQRIAISEAQANRQQILDRIRALEMQLAETKHQVELTIDQARTEVEVSQVEVADAMRNFERMSQLYDKKSLTPVEHDEAKKRLSIARLNLKLAQSGLEQATNRRGTIPILEAQLHEAGSMLDSFTQKLEAARSILVDHLLYAPIGGKIIQKIRNTGEIVNAGDPILQIVDMNSLYFEADIPEDYLDLFPAGRRVHVKLTVFPASDITGIVNHVDDASKESLRINLLTEDDEDREYRAHIAFLNPIPAVRIGLRGTIR